MKPNQIEVGKVYCNRGRGTTRRKVLEIGSDIPAPWYSMSPAPDDLVVRYEQNGKESTLYLRSFATWCGKEVAE